LFRDDAEQVPGRPRDKQFATEELSQTGDVDLHRRRRGARRTLAPDGIDEALRWNEFVRVQQQHREHGALLSPSQGERPPILDSLEGAEEPKFDHSRPIVTARRGGVQGSPFSGRLAVACTLPLMLPGQVMKNRFPILVVCLCVAATTAGSTVAARMSRSPVPPALVGTWRKTVTAATWRKHQIFYEAAGNWAITISKSGLTRIFAPPADSSGTALTTMRAAASGASLLFGPTADGFCPNAASYKAQLSAHTLALKAGKDVCEARRILLSDGSWTRSAPRMR